MKLGLPIPSLVEVTTRASATLRNLPLQRPVPKQPQQQLLVPPPQLRLPPLAARRLPPPSTLAQNQPVSLSLVPSVVLPWLHSASPLSPSPPPLVSSLSCEQPNLFSRRNKSQHAHIFSYLSSATSLGIAPRFDTQPPHTRLTLSTLFSYLGAQSRCIINTEHKVLA